MTHLTQRLWEALFGDSTDTLFETSQLLPGALGIVFGNPESSV
jgi:hypothetical protein